MELHNIYVNMSSINCIIAFLICGFDDNFRQLTLGSSWRESTLYIMYSGNNCFLNLWGLFCFSTLHPWFHFFFFFSRVNDFEDGNHFYRFLEHEPFIPRCHNFRGSTNDFEPKAAASISLRLTKIMSAILESYASEDGRHLNYVGISNSEEFRR